MMRLSRFGQSFGSSAGIVQLMDDLGDALAVHRDMLMLGGGNPGRIPQMQHRFRDAMRGMLDAGDPFDRLVGEYGAPQGDPRFLDALSGLLRRELGWDVGPANVALTNGSQSASFMLFNMLGGEREDGRHARILLPLAPEYIGYADQGVTPGLFVSHRPRIELLGERQFKYHVDFDALGVDDDVGAICVSRPTNPTGNVLTDDEMARLVALADQNDIPLIVDNAYGLPFPGIVFVDATPLWTPRTIVCMSLSKLGLPGVRTGIVVAPEPIVRALAGMNAIMNLTTAGLGPALTLDLVESGEIIRLGREVVRPFYQRKASAALERLERALDGCPFRAHRPEGAIFLWLWFPDLPVSSAVLYERLKARGVLVIPGHHFFPGLEGAWRHRDECIRVNYSQDDDRVARGLDIVAEEVRAAYRAG